MVHIFAFPAIVCMKYEIMGRKMTVTKNGFVYTVVSEQKPYIISGELDSSNSGWWQEISLKIGADFSG